MSEDICLHRAPGTCCPEPGCDYTSHDGQECKRCGAKCKDCRRPA
jgi:hypothetical protein